MPTFRHRETGKKVFFAHIPRTAGRFVEANLLENNFEWAESHLDTGLGVMSVVNGYEIAHFIENTMKSILMLKVSLTFPS